MSSTPERTGRPHDRLFQLVAAVAAVALVGFVIYVVVGPRGTKKATFSLAPPSSLDLGATAPTFSLPRLGGGAPVALGAAPGVPTVVNFFASWCPNCRAELTAFAAVAARNAARVSVVGIDSNDTAPANALRLLSGAHATYPVGVDANAGVASAYKLAVLPVTYFISARGTVVGVAFGKQSVNSLTQLERRAFGPAAVH